ncbi:transcription antitermination factor NusB [bacterium]|nr:transcription antitermination factor NusB [bacterium]
MKKTKRRRGRELALKALFAWDINEGQDREETFELFWTQAEDVSEEITEFAKRLIEGTAKNIETIDELIKNQAKNWQFSRLAYVDRNILRLSIFELLYCPDIPRAVTINEAIELAKTYSTADSSKFINGILDKIKENNAG